GPQPAPPRQRGDEEPDRARLDASRGPRGRGERMTTVVLHPDDLLDKDARGELDAGERARLDAHLAHCTSCRFERLLRDDFAADLSADMETPGLAVVLGGTWGTAPLAEPSGARVARGGDAPSL